MRARDVTVWRRQVLSSSLPLAAKVVALVLHEHMDWDGPEAGGNCWPSLSTIEVESGLPRRSVIRSVSSLLNAGWIERRCMRGCEVCRGGNGHLMAYTAHTPDPFQQGHDVTAQQGHEVTVRADSAVTSEHSAVTSMQPAGTSGHRQRGHGVTRPSLDLPEGDLPEDHADSSAANGAETRWPDGWDKDHPKVDAYVSVLRRLEARLNGTWDVVRSEEERQVQKLRNAAATAAIEGVDPYRLANIVTTKPLEGLTSYSAGLAKRIEDAVPTIAGGGQRE